jgi:hypothetical protein
MVPTVGDVYRYRSFLVNFFSYMFLFPSFFFGWVGGGVEATIKQIDALAFSLLFYIISRQFILQIKMCITKAHRIVLQWSESIVD